MNHHTRRARLLAALSVAALVAIASCGDDDDSTGSATTGTEAVKSTEAPGTSAPASSGASTSTSGATESTTEGTTAVTGKGEHSVGDEGEPVKGGTLVYGLEADTANAWAPYKASYATSGLLVLASITDSLFSLTDNGEVAPLLVESTDHNADYTEWTLHIRDGIKFHDGTPLDGAAVAFNIKTCAYAPLTVGAYGLTGDVTASGQDVTIKPIGGPWVALPSLFGVQSPCGHMLSAKWLASLPDVPQRNDKSPAYDAAVAATPADGDPAKPVGLGAFKFDSYTPGNGNVFKAVRNPDYWRGPNGITGEDLPYLDEIDAVVAVDVDSRASSLRSGQFNVIMTANADTIDQFLGDDAFEVNSSQRYGDTSYFMINVAQGDADPEGKNAASPLLNVDCRRALAYGIDTQRVVDERNAGLVSPANGPFPPGSLGYLEDSGYPTYDPDKAKSSMDTCLQALGTDHIEFSFNTTNDPFNVETVQLVESMWSDIFGDKVKASTTPIEQGQFIGLALTGAFNVEQWRSHSGFDPDQQRLWWQSSSATPIGGVALNFGRIKDPEMDAALNTIKTNPDPAARKAAAEQVNRIFGEKVYNWWDYRTLWGIISQPYVNGVQRNILPDGTKGIGLAFAGIHQVNEMWCDNGKCG